MDERSGETVEALSVWGALANVTWRYLTRGVGVWAVVGAMWGAAHLSGSNDASVIFWVLGLLVSFGAALVFPASVWQEYTESKRAKRRRELIRAAARSGVLPSQATREERLRQLLSDSSGTLLAAALVEALLIAPFALNPGMLLRYGGTIDWGFTIFALFVVLPLPLYIVYSLRADLNDVGSSSVATARAERAFREATRDKGGLQGSLVLDEHARQVGGELTMQVNAGGLEVHEEVALGLDGAQGAEAHGEVVAQAEGRS
jgi:hypothetical protein